MYWIPEEWERKQPVADADFFEVPGLDGWKKTPVTNRQVRDAVKILREVAYALQQTERALKDEGLLGEHWRTYSYCQSLGYIHGRLVDIVHMLGDDASDSAPEALRRPQKETQSCEGAGLNDKIRRVE